jgi:predicted ArsR family transcriptional regulator
VKSADASAEVLSSGSVDDAPTRERVAASILENGPSTAAALAARLRLTATAIRRHLDHLIATGAVVAREPKVYGARGRGRPAKVFVLTASGRDAFVQAYDDLALSALRFLVESGGPEAIGDFARRRTDELEARYGPTVVSAPAADRARVLAESLSQEGYAASVATTAVSDQICQHHCPVAHVAAQYPQLCEAETALFSRLLGRHVQRLATIAHGDGVCTTNVPHTVAAAPSTPPPSDSRSGRTAS